MKENNTEVNIDSKAIANETIQKKSTGLSLPAVSAIQLKKDASEKVEGDEPLKGKLQSAQLVKELAPAAEGTYSYTEPGFVTDTGSMRDPKLVSAIINERGSDEEKSKKIESGGGMFARLLGRSFKLQKELNPKKLGFYVPVKFDANNKNKVDKWVPTSIDFESPHLNKEDAKKLKSMGLASEGYFSSKKTIKSNLNLLKKEGVKLNNEDNSLKKAVDSSIVTRLASAVVNNSVTVRSMANEEIEKGIGKSEDAATKAVSYINSKAKKEIQILKDISFGLDSNGTKITPLGSIISVKGSYKDKFNFTSTFKVNTQTDYSSEYMGSVVTFTAFEAGDPAKVSIKLNPGELIHNPDADKQLLSSTNGSLTIGILGQEVVVNWSLLEIDANKSVVTQAKLTDAAIGVDLDHPATGTVIKGTANITNPAITEEKGFSFGDVNLDFPTITLFDGVSFTEVKAKLVSKEKGKVEISEGQAKFNVTLKDVANASGNVTFQKPDGAAASYTLSEGAFDTSIVGQKVAVSGVTYDSEKPKELSAKTASLILKVYGKDVSVVVSGPKVNETGFSYESATGTIKELVFGDAAKLTNIKVDVIKEENGTSLFGETNFALEGQIGGAEVKAATGKLKVSRTAESQETNLSFEGASFTLILFGQKINVSGLNYNNQILTAESASIEITAPVISDAIPEVAVGNLKISKDGYSFSEASVQLNASINFGIASANLTELKIENKDEGTKVSGSGALSVGGGTILGKTMPELKGMGTVSHQFKKDNSAGTSEKNFEGVEAKLPEFDLPKDLLPSGLWPVGVGFPIPIAPGVQVKIFAGVDGGLKSNDTSVSLIKKDKDTYTFGAQTTGLILSLNARIGAGVEGGVPFLASVMIGLEAEGALNALADMTFTKDFSIANPDERIEISKEDASSFTYKITGGVNLAANLVFEATALYFLSKKWTKNLAEKNLGSFEKENAKDWIFNGPAAPLQSEDDLMTDVSSNLPKSLKGKTKEELARLGQQKRFGNDGAADVVTEFSKTTNTKVNPQKLIDWAEFNYNRVDWSALATLLPVIIKNSDDSAEQVVEEPAPLSPTPAETDITADGATQPSWFQNFKEKAVAAATFAQEEMTYSKALEDLGKAINSKKTFIAHYESSARELLNTFSSNDAELEIIINMHLELIGIYRRANDDLKRKVHSSILGDKKAQALRQVGRFFGMKGMKATSQELLNSLAKVQADHSTVVELEKAYMAKHSNTATAEAATTRS